MSWFQNRFREFFICLCMVYLANGLNCFQCTLSDTECFGSLNKTQYGVDCTDSVFTLVNPQNEDYICIAMTTKNSTATQGTRRCGLKSESNICESLSQRGNGRFTFSECRVCQSDYCNSSVSFRSSLVVCLFGVIVLLFNK